MPLLSTAMIASQIMSAWTAAPNTYSLPKNPASGGIPVRANMKIGHEDGQAGLPARQSGHPVHGYVVLVAALDCEHDGERAQVHEGIDQEVVQGRLSTLRGARGETDENIAGVGDARIGQHALEARLAERRKVADGHRQHGEHREADEPGLVMSDQRGHHADEGGEGRGLGRHRHERGDRRRRALVDIRRPLVERDERHLEAVADEEQPDADRKQRGEGQGHRERRYALADLGQVGGARRTVDQGDAVKEEAAGKGAQQEVLQRRFGRTRIAAV